LQFTVGYRASSLFTALCVHYRIEPPKKFTQSIGFNYFILCGWDPNKNVSIVAKYLRSINPIEHKRGYSDAHVRIIATTEEGIPKAIDENFEKHPAKP
jgi:hypothetical protein